MDVSLIDDKVHQKRLMIGSSKTQNEYIVGVR